MLRLFLDALTDAENGKTRMPVFHKELVKDLQAPERSITPLVLFLDEYY